MSRFDWLRSRPQRLKTGSLAELLQDIAYCKQRGELGKLKSHTKTWRTRQQEAEAAVVERFGEAALLISSAAQPVAPADHLRRPLS